MTDQGLTLRELIDRDVFHVGQRIRVVHRTPGASVRNVTDICILSDVATSRQSALRLDPRTFAPDDSVVVWAEWGLGGIVGAYMLHPGNGGTGTNAAVDQGDTLYYLI